MAALKTILVYAEQSDAGAELLLEAARFAGRQGAHLVALTVGLQPLPVFVGYPDIPLDSDFIELREVREGVREAMAWVGDRLARTDVSVETRGTVVPAGEAGTAFARQARYADLAILPQEIEEGTAHRYVDAALTESGKPLIVRPAGAPLDPLGKRVAVCWDAGPEAARAVADALDIIIGAEDVRVVAVDPRVSADRHGEEPGAAVATMLARHGLPVTVDNIPRESRSIAAALLTHARGMGADLIVSGAYGHPRFSEMLLGGVTRDLVESTDRPLMMAR